MQPTFAPGASSRANFVASAEATSPWWMAWCRSWALSCSFGVQMPPDINGACSTELISLNVSQYLTRCPYRPNTTRQYRSKNPISLRSAQPS